MDSVDPQGFSEAREQPVRPGATYVEKALALVLLAILGIGCLIVLAPFLTAIFLAVTLCVSTWPVFKAVEKWLGGRTSAAALVMTLFIATLLVLPLVALGSSVAEDVPRLISAVRSGIERGLPPPDWLASVPFVGEEATQLWVKVFQQGAELGPTLQPYLVPVRDWALHQGPLVISGTLQVVFALVLAFILYRDGPQVEDRLDWAMSRVGGWRARRVLPAAGATIKSVVNGVLGTALVQGALLGFSFWVAGLPGGIVIGAVAMVLTLVPMGIALLWLPAGLWLMSQGQTGWAIFLMAWNGLFVGSLDNVLRPYLISRGVSMPMVLIFLGVLGGLLEFGILGVFLGPVLLAVVYSLFQDWEQPEDEVPPEAA